MLIPRHSRLLLFFAAAIILSACHSKKLTVRNNHDLEQNGVPVIKRGPYVMIKPDKEIAEKYAALMGVKRNEIQNGRLYSFIEEW